MNREKNDNYMDQKILKLKNTLQERGIQGLALDIDDTLSETNTHWFQHMFEFQMPENFTKKEMFLKYH